MTSTRELEDSLPLAASSHETDSEPLSDRKIAVYTLLALDDEQLQQLEQDINSADDISPTPVVQLANRPVFHNQKLLDIYNHHIRNRNSNTKYHPSCFIVADQNNWSEKGVLFVSLAASTEQRDSVIGVCRCDLEISTQIQANLDVGNMDWIDYKEMEEEEFGGENPYQNLRYYPNDPTTSSSA